MRIFPRIWAALLVAFFLAGPLVAQDTLTADFERWERTATSSEEALDAGGTSDERLNALRSEIVKFRSEFDAARDQNKARILALREQLAALSTPAETDSAAPVPPEVTAKREDVQAQLNALLEPVQRAEASFLRADALVTQIDRVLRERQTEQLLTVSPSPMNPANWQPAIDDLNRNAYALLQLRPTATAQKPWETLPLTAALTLLGFVLIFRGRRWSRMIVQSLQRFGARGFGIWRFLVSLLRIFLPFAGLVVLSIAAASTQMLSNDAEEIIQSIAVLGGVMLGIRWISERVFARDDDEALILIEPTMRAKARFNVWVITCAMVLGALISLVLDAGDAAAPSEAILLFVPLLIASIALYRIGTILRSYTETKPHDDAAAELRVSTLSRIVRSLGTGAVVVACISPLLLAAGYFKAADALLPPYIMTLALLGLVMAVQRFLADIYGAVTGQGDAGREALMPVIFGLLLIVCAAPLLALIWGARLTDLAELWSAFGRGFAIGDSRISPSDFLAFTIIFVIGLALTRLMQSALKTNVLPKTKIDIGGQNAIVSGLGYVGIFLAALLAINGAGIDLSSLAIVAGALSVGIGFGLQNIVSNFVSGIILLIERPISEGDWIEVGGNMGYVRDISVRSTRIETFDRTDVIVPNADLVSGTVTNYTRGNTVGRVIISVGVAYGTDTKRIEAILSEIAQEQPMVLNTPPPSVLFVNFGADSLEFEVRCLLRDVNWMMVVKSDINHAIAKRFAEEGIEIPFAQRDIWLRNPEALGQAKPKDGEPA